jgi:DNA-directed RNA polymerase II subunit RPB2
VRVKLHASRVPEIGDKFSSHHGQKGVSARDFVGGAIGIILKTSDMPFTIDGIAPDVIINPHALPGRMTVGQLIESLLGKLCCLEGRIGDGTPFNDVQPEDIGKQLRRYGFESRGNEVLFNGWTGEPLETEVCVGIVHYQRLRHCVVDKVHARSRGPVQLITRQPVEGRSRGGGLRVGEMERDCMLAHGASAVILDRLF